MLREGKIFLGNDLKLAISEVTLNGLNQEGLDKVINLSNWICTLFPSNLGVERIPMKQFTRVIHDVNKMEGQFVEVNSV